MHDCPNQLEESNIYSASVLPKHLLKHEFHRRKACQKSNAICIMAIMSSTLWRPLYPCFLIVPHCIGLKWCSNIVIIFLIYLSIHTSTVEHPKQNEWFDMGTSLQCCFSPHLPLKHYCMVLLALDSPSSTYLAKWLRWYAYKTNIIVAGLLQLIETITHTWSVRASSQDALLQPKFFPTVWFLCMIYFVM